MMMMMLLIALPATKMIMMRMMIINLNQIAQFDTKSIPTALHSHIPLLHKCIICIHVRIHMNIRLNIHLQIHTVHIQYRIFTYIDI